MKKIICLFFIAAIITLSGCKDKEGKELKYTQFKQLANKINTDLQKISSDIKDLTLTFKYKIPFDNSVEWDNKKYTLKNNQLIYTPDQKQSSAIYFPINRSLTDSLKNLIVNSEQMDSLFIRFMDNHDFVRQIYFLDPHSFLRIYPYTEFPGCFSSPKDLTQRFPYQKACHKPFLNEKSYWVCNPYADLLGQGWVISCVEPLYYHDRFLGIVAVDIPVKNILQKYFNHPTQRLILTNKKGEVICTTPNGAKKLNIPMYREFSYYEPLTQNTLMYHSPSLANHQNKKIQKAIQNLLDGSLEENFFIDGKKHTIYKAEITETNWLLLKIIY
ncbi:MAG: PDC sensor domain-containing protein [Bacteroidales bacterium]|jgi:hypothetical protein|nr:PDC sensor domain-containing protein [Bacteroidales bacterium]